MYQLRNRSVRIVYTSHLVSVITVIAVFITFAASLSDPGHLTCVTDRRFNPTIMLCHYYEVNVSCNILKVSTLHDFLIICTEHYHQSICS